MVLLLVLCFGGIGYNGLRRLYCRLYGGDFGDFFEYGHIDGVISAIGLIDGCIGEVV